MSKRIKILTPRIYEHSDFFHNAYDFARKKSLNTNELCLELSHYLVEHFDNVWKIEKPRIYEQICDLQSQLQQANEIINNPDTLIFQQQELIDNLQKTIEEKNKEIERLNACVDFYKSYYISFKEKVIDELEKVKGHFYENTYSCSYKIGSLSVFDFIDKQINELKGGE